MKRVTIQTNSISLECRAEDDVIETIHALWDGGGKSDWPLSNTVPTNPRPWRISWDHVVGISVETT